MSLQNPYGAYQQAQTLTTSKLKLIVMLHDGLLRFLAQAANATTRRDFPEKGKYFGRAFAILNHLIATLDKPSGGKLADDLEKFYMYFRSQLMLANAHNDVRHIKQIMSHIRDVRNAWATVESDARVTTAEPMAMERDESGEGLLLAA
jgi:flagellar protein FliS